MSINETVQKYVAAISEASSSNYLKDSGSPIELSQEDRETLRSAMIAAREEDSHYRKDEGISIPADDFAKDGAWHRAANKVIFQSKIYGGDLAHRVLMTAVQ